MGRLEAFKEKEKQRKSKRKRHYLFLIILVVFLASIFLIDSKTRELLGDESLRIFSYSYENGHNLKLLGNNYKINYNFINLYDTVKDKLYDIIEILKRELKAISSFLFVFHLYSLILKNSML